MKISNNYTYIDKYCNNLLSSKVSCIMLKVKYKWVGTWNHDRREIALNRYGGSKMQTWLSFLAMKRNWYIILCGKGRCDTMKLRQWIQIPSKT